MQLYVFSSWEDPSWRSKWQPTPVFLPGKSCGQRSLMDYSTWGRKELDTTEQLTHTHMVSKSVLNIVNYKGMLDEF